jgi:hypothetical protein
VKAHRHSKPPQSLSSYFPPLAFTTTTTKKVPSLLALLVKKYLHGEAPQSLSSLACHLVLFVDVDLIVVAAAATTTA